MRYPASARLVHRLDRALTGPWAPTITGVLVGIAAPLLVVAGNPLNMGLSVACFLRDIAGALGLHGSEYAQYLRPEIPGLVLGAWLAALVAGEARSRQGSSPLIRFVLGLFASVGALVFLGCPWRAILRLGAGDLNALWGILGLLSGVRLGLFFLSRGFELGRSQPAPVPLAWVTPVAMASLVLLLILAPPGIRDQGNASRLAPLYSSIGCGALRAPVLLSLSVAMLIGVCAQRSRFCVMAALRNVLLMRHLALVKGLAAMLVSTFLVNLLVGQFALGFEGQPIAHTSALCNFGGLLLTGVASTLAGGCPSRQLVLSGEGDADAGVFVLGMLVGAALAQSFGVASSSDGLGQLGPQAVILGLAVCIVIGLAMRPSSPG